MKRFLICLLLLAFGIRCLSFDVGAEKEYGHVYCKNAICEKQIALTFDDGPHPRYTEEILKILAEYRVTATFFMIGINAVNYPKEVAKILESGCEIGNHTYSHTKISVQSEEQIRAEIFKCEQALLELTGERPSLFRPPEGKISESMKGIASEMNYDVILWSIDTLDWAMNPSENICRTVMEQVRGGDIILMHDYVSGGNTTCDALRKIIPALLAEGYEFVTVSQLLQKTKNAC